MPLYVLTFLLSFLCAIYTWRFVPDPGKTKAFLALMLLLETGMAGTFIAFDLILFFVFWEMVLVPMYFLIGIWGSANREYAAIKFFLYTLFG
jgi:NADH-quinone oxidoreductase subunit M